jgi:hypothetical protein
VCRRLHTRGVEALTPEPTHTADADHLAPRAPVGDAAPRLPLYEPMQLRAFLTLTLCACTSSNVDSNEQARRAYLGLDESISKSLDLAFAGYNAASSANIPTELGSGAASGTITVAGKVSHGNPQQASMSVTAALDQYSDGPFAVGSGSNSPTISVEYTSGSGSAAPALGIKLNASAGNALDGTLTGDYDMTGDLTGSVTLDLTLTGQFSGSGTAVERVPGSTTVTGTAVNASGGVFDVNVTL